MVERELGERNFGFDSLKSRLKRDMEEYGKRLHTTRRTMERRRKDMDPI
jgi:hypothetical protein